MSPFRQRCAFNTVKLELERSLPTPTALDNGMQSTQDTTFSPGTAMSILPSLPGSSCASPMTLSPASRNGSFSSVEEASVGLAEVTPAFFGPNSAPIPYPSYPTYPNNSLGLLPDTFLTLDAPPAASALGIDFPYNNESRPSVFYIPDVDNVHASDYSFQPCHRSPLRASFQVISPCAPTMDLLGHFPFPSSLMSATADMALSAAPSTASSSYVDLAELNDSEAQLHGAIPRSVPSRRPGGLKSTSAGVGFSEMSEQWSGRGGGYEKSGLWNGLPAEFAKSRQVYIGNARGEIRPAEFDSPEGDGKKRLRTLQACEKCRLRKAKCNGARPCCGRCETRGLDCFYAPERRMRGPNKKASQEVAASAASRPRPEQQMQMQQVKMELSDDSSSEDADGDGDLDYQPQQAKTRGGPSGSMRAPAPPTAASQASATALAMAIPGIPTSHGYLGTYGPKISASRQPLSQSPQVPPSPYLPFQLSPNQPQPATFADVQQIPYPLAQQSVGLGMSFADGHYPPRPSHVRHGHSSSSSSSISLSSPMPAYNGAMLSPSSHSGSYSSYDQRESPYGHYTPLPPAQAIYSPYYPASAQPFVTTSYSGQQYTYMQPAPNGHLDESESGLGAASVEYGGTTMETGVSNTRSEMKWQSEA